MFLVASDSLNENSTKIAVNVRDVNDLPPVFERSSYNKVMNEERPAPFRMIQVLFKNQPFTFLSGGCGCTHKYGKVSANNIPTGPFYFIVMIVILFRGDGY